MIAAIRAVLLFGAPFAGAVVSLLLVEQRPVAAAVLFAVCAAAGLGSELLLRRDSRTWDLLEQHHLGYTVRFGFRDLVLLLLAALWPGATSATTWLVTSAVFVGFCGRLLVGALTLAAQETRKPPVTWRNLAVPGARRSPRRFAPVLAQTPKLTVAMSALLAAGVALAVAGASPLLLWLAALIAAAAAIAMVVMAVLDLLAALSDSHGEQVVDAVAAALRDLAPDVLFYYSRPERTGYIANVWMPTLQQLAHHRCVVFVREEHNRELVHTTLPLVCIPRPNDLEKILPPSVRVALYPSNVVNNNHMIRLPGIVDVFVGHGDSDKGGSATTLSRIYDEVWVSGPAGRDRYRVADVGVRDEQIREVGRPQLAEITRVARRLGTGTSSRAGDPAPGIDAGVVAPNGAEHTPAATPYAVLYAPTREGFFAEWDYSSVLSQGDGILRTLLAAPGIQVLFKPHPGTGTDDPAYAIRVQQLRDLVLAAGQPHQVVTGSEGLYHAFNRADLLVSDVSSVITDFLASGKPYVVTNSGSGSDEQFRAQFPSAGGAYILGGDGTAVLDLIELARGEDPLREARERTARYLLGDAQADPLRAFDDAITAAVSAAPQQGRGTGHAVR